jgi:hypothetical protein
VFDAALSVDTELMQIWSGPDSVSISAKNSTVMKATQRYMSPPAAGRIVDPH